MNTFDDFGAEVLAAAREAAARGEFALPDQRPLPLIMHASDFALISGEHRWLVDGDHVVASITAEPPPPPPRDATGARVRFDTSFTASVHTTSVTLIPTSVVNPFLRRPEAKPNRAQRRARRSR